MACGLLTEAVTARLVWSSKLELFTPVPTTVVISPETGYDGAVLGTGDGGCDGTNDGGCDGLAVLGLGLEKLNL